MKLKKILAGLMAAVIAVGSFMVSTASAYWNQDTIDSICKKTNAPVWKNGETKTLTLVEPDIKNTGWYYSIPVSSNGTVEVNATTFDPAFVSIALVNADIYTDKTYENRYLSDSEGVTTNSTFGKAYDYGCVFGEKNGKKEVIQYEVRVCGGRDGDGTDADSYSGMVSFDVKKNNNYMLAVFSEGDSKLENRKVTLSVTYPSSSDKSSNNISELSINKITSKSYTGKAIKPSITIKDGNKKLVSGTDYTVTYKNNTKPGKATATITGKGDYTGTKTVTFNIAPKKVKLSAKTSGAGAVLSWKKSTGATGYEIYYSTNGGKFRKLTTVKSAKYTAELTSGSAYKFRVRPYVNINGKKVYGKWSNTVSCK